jgi:hypothetical protein
MRPLASRAAGALAALLLIVGPGACKVHTTSVADETLGGIWRAEVQPAGQDPDPIVITLDLDTDDERTLGGRWRVVQGDREQDTPIHEGVATEDAVDITLTASVLDQPINWFRGDRQDRFRLRGVIEYNWVTGRRADNVTFRKVACGRPCER